MLDLALKFLQDELNSFLLAQTDAGPNAVQVQLKRLVDEAGKYAFDLGSLGLSVINVEEERLVRTQVPQYAYVNGQHVVMEPDLKLNVYVLFAANFSNYSDALRNLSYVLLFFASHPAFSRPEYPALDPGIEKLVVELYSLTFEQLSQVWTFIGGKQLLSVVYRVRMVVLQPAAPTSVQPPLTRITAVLHSQ